MNVKWNKIYDWRLVNVRHPYLITNGQRYVYCVDVEFMHHGVTTAHFFVGHDRLMVTGDKLARQTAIAFYLRMRRLKSKQHKA